MKKLYFTFISVLCAFGLNAQTITATNHNPVNGEQYSTYQCDSLTVSVGANGAGVTWNFNSIVTHSSVIANYTASTGSWTNFPQANIAVSSSTLDQSYYKTLTGELAYWGGNIGFGGVNASLNYTSPATFMAYPTSLNTGTLSPIGGSLVVLGNNGTFTGVCTSSATATGTLVLPAKTFTNVIRVTTTQTITFNAVVTGSASNIVNEFYSLSDSKFPILSITSSSVNSLLGNSDRLTATVQKNYHTVGLNETAKSEVNLNVFPNPAHSHLNFVTDAKNAKVLVYDIMGKLIDNQTLINGKLTLDVSEYNNGLYIYKLVDNNRALKTGRITVAH